MDVKMLVNIISFEHCDWIYFLKIVFSTLIIIVVFVHTQFSDKIIRLIVATTLVLWWAFDVLNGLKNTRPSCSQGRRKKSRIDAGEDPSLVDVQNKSDYLQKGKRKVRARLDGSEVGKSTTTVRLDRARLVDTKDNIEQRIMLPHATEEQQVKMETVDTKEDEELAPGPVSVEHQEKTSNSVTEIMKSQIKTELDCEKQPKNERGKKSRKGKSKGRARLNGSEVGKSAITARLVKARLVDVKVYIEQRIMLPHTTKEHQVEMETADPKEDEKQAPDPVIVEHQEKTSNSIADEEIIKSQIKTELDPEKQPKNKKDKKNKKGRRSRVNAVLDNSNHQTMEGKQDVSEDVKLSQNDNSKDSKENSSVAEPNFAEGEEQADNTNDNNNCKPERNACMKLADEDMVNEQLQIKDSKSVPYDVPLEKGDETEPKKKDNGENKQDEISLQNENDPKNEKKRSKKKKKKKSRQSSNTNDSDDNKPEENASINLAEDIIHKQQEQTTVIAEIKDSESNQLNSDYDSEKVLCDATVEKGDETEQKYNSENKQEETSSQNENDPKNEKKRSKKKKKKRRQVGNANNSDDSKPEKNASNKLAVEDIIHEQQEQATDIEQIKDNESNQQNSDYIENVLYDVTPEKSDETEPKEEDNSENKQDESSQNENDPQNEKKKKKKGKRNKNRARSDALEDTSEEVVEIGKEDIEPSENPKLECQTITECHQDYKQEEKAIEYEAGNEQDTNEHVFTYSLEELGRIFWIYSYSIKEHIEALPEVSEAPKKSTRKQRKRRNPNKSKFKSSMDDSSETSSNSDMSTKNDVQPEKTVIYTPLSLYLQLNLDMYTLYHELRNHLLTREQMKLYGFPEEAPDRPGRAIMRTQNVTKGSTERRCCRCGSAFNILPDGRYVSDTLCRYHARKQLPYRRGHPYRGDYPCCNGDYMSEGCVTWQYHVTAESALHDVEFVKTKSKKHLNEVTAGTVYALDCEMLYTTAGMEVAKVGIVGIDGLTVFESFVLPQNQILDYNTVYSGVTEKDLKGVTMTLVDVQTYLLKLLNQESILVGHGLENDLKALRLIHSKIVDTSVVFPFPHTRVHKKSLKNLALEFLNKDIQQSANGHNCIEDARTCMELMLHKISTDIEDRPPVTQDENKNSILQNTSTPEFHPAKYPVYQPWSYTCQYSYCSDSYRNSFYSGSLMPKNYNNCIYG